MRVSVLEEIPIIIDGLSLLILPLDSIKIRLENRNAPKKINERNRSIIITLLGKGLKGSGKNKKSKENRAYAKRWVKKSFLASLRAKKRQMKR